MSKIVFFGFGKLGKDCMVRLNREGHEISHVFTHKDMTLNSVDLYAQDKNIPFSYKDLRKFPDLLNSHNFEESLLVSINYRFILDLNIINKFLYAINLHGSLLPKYRGRTPHVWAIINGEKKTGVTAHIIDKGVDTGPIIKQEEVDISPSDTGHSLLLKFEKIYPDLLISSIKNLVKGCKLKVQDNNEASFFGKREPIMGYIDFQNNSKKIIDFVRAQSNPYPGAYSFLEDGKKIIINKLGLFNEKKIDLCKGKIKKINNDYYVRCKDSILKILDYKLM